VPRALRRSKGRTQLVDCVRGRAERTMAGVVELRRTIGLLDSAATASSSSDDPLDLPPLTADGPVSMQLAEPEGEEELSFMDSVFCNPPPEERTDF